VIKHLGKNLTIVLALLAVGFLVAWLRFRPYLGSEGRFSDGVKQYDVDGADEVRYAVWAPRKEVTGEVNSDGREGRLSVSPDGRFAVFGVGERGLGCDLYIAEMVGGEPRDVRPLSELNSSADEMAPCFGPDALWFASDRLGTLGGLDLWRAPYAAGSFGTPEHVNGGVNSTSDDTDPAPLVGVEGFAFSSNRRRGLRDDHDLYLARPQVDPEESAQGWTVEGMEALNSNADDRDPAFTRDGRCMFLASDRAGAPGDFDLYRTAIGLWSGQSWAKPEPLLGVNSDASERGPSPSFDGFSLYFSSTSTGRDADLYRARSLELFRTPGRPVGWRELLVIGLLLLAAILAWLAKRWEQVEIVYKCFLISAVVHLILMWWMRDVYPEGSPYDMDGDSSRVRVRLVASDSAQGRNAERSGQLDVGREESEAQPERLAAAGPDLRASLNAGTLQIEPVPAEPASAPARSASEVEATTPPSTDEQVAMRRDASAIERPTVPRSELAVQATATEADRSPEPERQPARAATETGLAVLRDSTPDASRRSGGDPDLLAQREAFVPAAQPATVERTRATRVPEVSTAQSSEAFERRESPSAELALQSQRLAGLEERAASGARPDRSRAALDGARDLELQVSSVASTPERRRTVQSAPRAMQPLTRSELSIARPERDANAPDTRHIDLQAPPVPEGTRAESRPPEIAQLSLPKPTALGLTPTRSGRTTGRASPRRRPLEAQARRRLPEPERPIMRPLMAMAMPAEVVLPERDRDWDHTPYQSRVGEAKVRAIEEHGGSTDTERAVEAGLEYLARIRSPQGYWGSADDRHEKYGHVAVGKTGLCLLAYLGAGHTPGSETEYSSLTRSAVDFLLTVQDERSGHFGYSSSYSHAIATYALAECYALTHSERLRAPLEAAVAHILSRQENSSDRRFHGGWGYYYPGDREFDRWPRVSVTVWQVMALESARIGGLSVPDRAFENAHAFLLSSWDTDHNAFRYSHDPARLRSNWPILPGSTPAALFALSLLGDDTSSRTFGRARSFVLERAPHRYEAVSDDDFVLRARGNLYFWYYGTLALFRVGGAPWKEWNQAMKSTLLPSQMDDGSWIPISTYADYAGDSDEDRSYTTAMCVLSLEVYYRYFTPLLKIE